jgi:hypothetical protein
MPPCCGKVAWPAASRTPISRPSWRSWKDWLAGQSFPPNGWGYLDNGVYVCNDDCTLPRRPELLLARHERGTFVVLIPNLPSYANCL